MQPPTRESVLLLCCTGSLPCRVFIYRIQVVTSKHIVEMLTPRAEHIRTIDTFSVSGTAHISQKRASDFPGVSAHQRSTSHATPVSEAAPSQRPEELRVSMVCNLRFITFHSCCVCTAGCEKMFSRLMKHHSEAWKLPTNPAFSQMSDGERSTAGSKRLKLEQS